MKKFYRSQDGYLTTESVSEEMVKNFDRFRVKYNTPFKPRAPTPPRGRNSLPRELSQLSTCRYRHSSVDSAGVFVLKVPFSSVNYLNQMAQLQTFKVTKYRGQRKTRMNFAYRKHKRSESLEVGDFN
ncbi:hypothetical protein SteCoe_15783 [Stentor coeruleus]|uniref:Uncharacterized protein n=1 Tax=Stentor coeruleus TaxID=5963 RepID=A0A1R2C2W5_9CILI|nr:hypothetical protein SteCoe_15783 [Stentor coeruleus]